MATIRLLAATFAGGVVLVVWGMLFWGLLAPPVGAFHELPDAADVTRRLEENETATGTYFMPWPRGTPEEFEEFTAQHRRGPFFQLHYVAEGVDPNSPRKLLVGTLHLFAVAFLAAVLLVLANARSFLRRTAVVVVAGGLGSLFITVADPIWFHLPWDHTLADLAYEIVAWLLLGATTAAVVRPRSEPLG